MAYEVHWAISNRADEVAALRTGAHRYERREDAEAERRTIRPPKPDLVALVVEVRSR